MELKEFTTGERLELFNMLTSACQHLYSKNKLQVDKFQKAAELFVKIAQDDPVLMVHLTAWSMSQDSKDLKVMAVYFNSLSDADGSPFSPGSKYVKPNFRKVSAALLQELDPKLALRVLKLARSKFEVKDDSGQRLYFATHFPTVLNTAFKNYIVYRDTTLHWLKKLKEKGYTTTLQQLYRLAHMAPSPQAVEILGWNQSPHRGKNKNLGKMKKKVKLSFEGMNPSQIARTIVRRNISPLVALSLIPEGTPITAKIGFALLEQCSGNQAIVLQNVFFDRGLLEIPEIKELFDEKVSQATTAVDRIDTLSKGRTDEEKKVMSKVRSKRRKEQLGKIGSVYLHIDKSVSMRPAIELAKRTASIIAEAVNEPEKNFHWGLFGASLHGKDLPVPGEFVKEAFEAALYGVVANDMGTNTVGCYELARKAGAEVDIYLTDEEHNAWGQNSGAIVQLLKNQYKCEEYKKPKAAVIVRFDKGYTMLEDALREIGIPVTIISPESLTESALVIQSVRNAVKGQTAIIDEILSTKLPELPDWYNNPEMFEEYRSRFSE